jgi:hypothetical protein
MDTISPISAEDRRRLWHPRGALCAVCRQPTRGLGWFDPVLRAASLRKSSKHAHARTGRPRPSVWFCSMSCQSYWARLAREPLAMVDLTEEERVAITATVKRMALLMEDIGWSTPLAELTEAQVRALIEEAVEGFREAMSDIARANAPEVPF